MSLRSSEAMSVDRRLPTPNAVASLTGQIGGIRISFYLTTGGDPARLEAAEVQLKNEADAARKALAQRGLDEDAVERMLAPIDELIADSRQLARGGEGVAILIGEDECILLDLPHPVADSMTVSNRFFLKPLIPYLNDGGAIYLLQLSRNATSMHRRGINALENVAVPEMPASIHATTAFDDPEKSLQRHGGEPRGGEGRPGAEPGMPAHGQGSPKDREAEQIHRFNHQVARAVEKFLRGSRKTLVVVGDESNVGEFRQAADFGEHRLVTRFANPADWSGEQLWELCAEIASEIALEQIEATLGELRSIDSGKLIDDPKDAALAASQGAVSRCVVASDEETIGVVSAETNQADTVEDDAGAGCAHDLLDQAAQETIRKGGVAYAVRRDLIPNGAVVLAERRF